MLFFEQAVTDINLTMSLCLIRKGEMSTGKWLN